MKLAVVSIRPKIADTKSNLQKRKQLLKELLKRKKKKIQLKKINRKKTDPNFIRKK